MAQTANFLIAGIPAVPGTAFTAAQLSAIKLGLSMSPTNYPAWVIRQYNAQLEGLPLTSPQAPTPATSNPPQSSGQQVGSAQTAKDNNANTQSPEKPKAVQAPNGRVNNANAITQPTNAQTYKEDVTTGTNSPVRSLAATQTVPAPTANPYLDPTKVTSASATWQNIPERRPTPGSTQGAYAWGDDGSNPTRTLINSLSSMADLVPQENILSKYASYTYNLSLYMLTREDYARMINSKVKVVPGEQLLISSGGIGPSVGAPSAGSTTNPIGTTDLDKYLADLKNVSSGRNQFFPLDYYFDEFIIKHKLSGKGTRSPINVTEMRFKIVEPNGISLLDNLDAAVKKYVGNGKKSWQSQHFLMYIKFYGYDDQGNLVAPTNRDPLGVVDKTAIVEKFIPFIFTGIKFRIANKLTEWDCSAAVPAVSVAAGQARGVIPYNVELTATTLKNLFNGPPVYQTTFNPDGRASGSSTSPNTQGSTPGAAPPKANSAPKPSIVSGVVEAMNLFEEELVETGVFDVANKYEVTFTSSILEEAETMPPGGLDKSQTPMMQNPSNANQILNPATQSMDPNAKTISAVAGTSLIQFIDRQVRASSYIWDQQIWQIDPDSGDVVPNGSPAQSMGWYIIGLQADPIEYDEKRFDYAYKITYQISPMIVSNIESEWFPKSKFQGVHKRYNYWFTGENTEVLNYEQNFNNLYFQVVNGVQPNTNETLDPRIYREYIKREFQTRSNESDQGQAGKVNEPGANAADFLYSPNDLSRCKLTILGDPAWIFQGDLWAGVAGQKILYDGFFPDGTINVETRQAKFEIAFNAPVDYDTDLGIMDPRSKRNGANRNLDLAAEAKYLFVFIAIECTSSFSRGKFTQDLEGNLERFPINQNQIVTGKLVPDATRAAQNDPVTQQQLAEKNARQTNNAAPNSLKARRTTLTPVTSANSSSTESTSGTASNATPVQPGTAKAAAPTSQGQPVGTTTPTGNTNPQTGGTRATETTTTVFDINVLRQNDPETYAAYTQYRQEQYRAATTEQIDKLSAQYIANNPKTSPSVAYNRVLLRAQTNAGQQADAAAMSKFKPQLVKSGALVTTSSQTPQTPVTTAPPQIQAKDR